jgi:hypothetical protein
MEAEQIESLISTPEQELLLQWYDEELKHTVGGSADDLVSTIGELREAFLSWAIQVNLRDLICKRWDYRSKKEEYTTAVQFASALCDFLVSLKGYPSPATVAVIIVQWAGDKLCDVS